VGSVSLARATGYGAGPGIAAAVWRLKFHDRLLEEWARRSSANDSFRLGAARSNGPVHKQTMYVRVRALAVLGVIIYIMG
jgi:hypothetical protein